MANKVLVVAIGGNSLIKDAKHQTVPDQIASWVPGGLMMLVRIVENRPLHPA